MRVPILALCCLALCAPSLAQRTLFDPTNPPKGVGWDQKMNGQVPEDLVFTDESGKKVKLGDYFGKKPVILNMIFYKCSGVCVMETDGMVKAFVKLNFDIGKEYEVITVSIDPKETPGLAVGKKQEYMTTYDRPSGNAGWHFLVGSESEIERLANAVGFQYTYDAKSGRLTHPAGIMVLTPEGRISRYFITTQYRPKDLRLALVEASANKIGSAVDKFVLLTCLYRYDPHTGKYGVYIFRAVQLAGFATFLVLGSFMTVMFLRDRRAAQAELPVIGAPK